MFESSMERTPKGGGSMRNENKTGTIIKNKKTQVKEQSCIAFDITSDDETIIRKAFSDIKTLINNRIIDIKDNTEDSWWVLHNQTKVLAGKGRESLPLDEIHPHILKELRLFSAKGELHLWKCKEGFCYRLRLDKESNDISKSKDENENGLLIYMEEHYRTKVKGSGEKDRSTSGFKFLGCSGKPPDRFKVYNYFKYDGLGCIQFEDARLVEFIEKGEN